MGHFCVSACEDTDRGFGSFACRATISFVISFTCCTDSFFTIALSFFAACRTYDTSFANNVELVGLGADILEVELKLSTLHV